MKILRQVLLALLLTAASLVSYQAVTEAAGMESDLLLVTVQVKVENPEYFWNYPFEGRAMDGIRVSGLGKTFTINAPSSGEKLGFEVPKDYKFRIYVDFLSNGATVKSLVYSSRWGVDRQNKEFTITLKAPEPQSVITQVQGLEEIKR